MSAPRDIPLTRAQKSYVAAFMAYVRAPTAKAYLERRTAFTAMVGDVGQVRGEMPRPCPRCGRLMRGCQLSRHQASPRCVPSFEPAGDRLDAVLRFSRARAVRRGELEFSDSPPVLAQDALADSELDAVLVA